MLDVVIVGGGVAGMGAAQRLLAAGLSVTLIEPGRRLGGNCLAVEVRANDGSLHRIDAGVSDFNRTRFLEVARLIDALGLPTRPIGTDVDFVTPAGRSVAHCRSGCWSFDSAPERELSAEIARFAQRVPEVLEDARFRGWSAARYLDFVDASEEFRQIYFYPRAAGSFPVPDVDPAALPITELARFWHVHGVVGSEPARRHCVIGGMHRYMRAFENSLREAGASLLTRHRVLGISRRDDSSEICIADHEDRHRTLRARQVVLAVHAREALTLLSDVTPDERDVLMRFPLQRARLVVHRDEALMGHDPECWGAFNYVVAEGGEPRVRPTITFYPRRLAGLGEELRDVFVTMNPVREPRPDRILVDRWFVHPVMSRSGDRALARASRMQGQNGTWFAGAWLRPPFVHESALCSGYDVAERLLVAESSAVA